MNKTITILLIAFTTMVSAAVFADKNIQHSSSRSQSVSSMVDMGAIQKNMDKMQNLMEKISNSQNPKEKKKLMVLHMQEMHKGMDMIKAIKMDDMGNAKSVSGDGNVNTNSNAMTLRQDMMEQRMDMMQMLTEQLMDHLMEGLDR